MLALGKCINALSMGTSKFVPFRESLLTRLLKSSFSGNSKTIMIGTLSPSLTHYEDSFNTLRFADRAKAIKVNPTEKSISFSSNLNFKEHQFQQEIEKKNRMILELEENNRNLKESILQLQQNLKTQHKINQNNKENSFSNQAPLQPNENVEIENFIKKNLEVISKKKLEVELEILGFEYQLVHLKIQFERSLEKREKGNAESIFSKLSLKLNEKNNAINRLNEIKKERWIERVDGNLRNTLLFQTLLKENKLKFKNEREREIFLKDSLYKEKLLQICTPNSKVLEFFSSAQSINKQNNPYPNIPISIFSYLEPLDPSSHLKPYQESIQPLHNFPFSSKERSPHKQRSPSKYLSSRPHHLQPSHLQQLPSRLPSSSLQQQDHNKKRKEFSSKQNLIPEKKKEKSYLSSYYSPKKTKFDSKQLHLTSTNQKKEKNISQKKKTEKESKIPLPNSRLPKATDFNFSKPTKSSDNKVVDSFSSFNLPKIPFNKSNSKSPSSKKLRSSKTSFLDSQRRITQTTFPSSPSMELPPQIQMSSNLSNKENYFKN